MDVGIVLLASGFSRRMGRNKLLMPVGGKPMALAALRAVPQRLKRNAVVVTQWEGVAELAEREGLRVLRNRRAQEGVSASIRLGIGALPGMDGYLFCVCDQPNLSMATVEKLIAEFSCAPGRIYAAAANGKRGNPVLFPASLKGELLELTGEQSGRLVIGNHPNMLSLVEIPEAELEDIDCYPGP